MFQPFEYIIMGMFIAAGIFIPSSVILFHTNVFPALLANIIEIIIFVCLTMQFDLKFRAVYKEKLGLDNEFEAQVNAKTQHFVDMIIKLEHLASVDYLTEVANCRHIRHLMSEELARSHRTNHPFSIIMLDVDHFKKINDTYGHPDGDLVLQAVAKVCKDTVREIDHVGRVGGEEFLIILPETTVFDAGVIAERIRDRIEFLTIGDQGIKVTVSLGVSSSDTTSNVDSMYKTADVALYDAKENGRNCVVYSLDMDNRCNESA